jgi:chromosomal replication initiation ATPase DnaA
MSLTEDYRAIRARLMRPPGGRVSDERDIESAAERRKQVARAMRDQISMKAERSRRAGAMLANYKFELDAWVESAEFELLDPPLPEAVEQSGNLPAITLSRIIQTVCDYYSLHRNCIGVHQRTAPVVHVHQVIMYLSRRHTKLSWAMVGARLNRDHTTVMYGHRKIRQLLGTDDKLAADISAICERLGVV